MISGIYDFETLSQDVFNGTVVSLAALVFDENRFISDEPYEFFELVDMCKFIKFDVEEQVKVYGRKISTDTLKWWKENGGEAIHSLKPSDEDRSISELYSFLYNEVGFMNCSRVYTRGNTFDPIFLQSILNHFGQTTPYPWWTIRDTRSLIDGMTYGSKINNKFIPPEVEEYFIAHNPKHDIACDVMRIQYIARLFACD
jgi:hypothetical protein